MFCLTLLVSLLSIVCASNELSTDRIVGGRSASIHEAKYQASIQREGYHFCAGAIISPKIVLSASHCFKKFEQSYCEKLTVRFGSSYRSSGGVLKNVESFLMHPQFDRQTLENDIALVKLTSGVVPSAVIQFIQLSTHTPIGGTRCTISGWGTENDSDKIIPEGLKLAEVDVVSNERCASSEFDYGAVVTPKVFCAIGEGVDSCKGDSGGPIKNNDDGTLAGIVSFGYGCASTHYPGIYTDVALYNDWIMDNIRTL